jgi:hypothetical protein
VSGRVEAIYVSPAAGVLPDRLDEAEVVAGRGIPGDRYFLRTGTYSNYPDQTGRDLTLVEAEALERAGVSGAESRRAVVVRGVELSALIGKRFRLGELECYGTRACEPCKYLEDLLGKPVLRTLAHTGLRVDVLVGGRLSVGDELYSIDSGESSRIEGSTTSASASASSSGG